MDGERASIECFLSTQANGCFSKEDNYSHYTVSHTTFSAVLGIFFMIESYYLSAVKHLSIPASFREQVHTPTSIQLHSISSQYLLCQVQFLVALSCRLQALTR